MSLKTLEMAIGHTELCSKKLKALLYFVSLELERLDKRASIFYLYLQTSPKLLFIPLREAAPQTIYFALCSRNNK